MLFQSLFFCLLLSNLIPNYNCYSDDKWPAISISVLVRNKAESLPYFLSCLYNLDYPKDRIYLWLYTDHNEDNTEMILTRWVLEFQPEFYKVNFTVGSRNKTFEDESSPSHWSKSRFRHIMSLREEALNEARRRWAQYIFMLDADVFLVENSTLKDLISKDLTAVAPLLLSDGLYSNFWAAMTGNYYYKRSEDYKEILNRQQIGCIVVPMIHSAVLINLNKQSSDSLSYIPEIIERYDGPEDDIIAFAVSARNKGIPLHICNDKYYGYIPIPLEMDDPLTLNEEQLVNIKLKSIGRGTPLPLHPVLAAYVNFPEPSSYGFDTIYMINLKRRSERREIMEQTFRELGIKYEILEAVDGQELNAKILLDNSIYLMSNYLDPYHRRPMTMGEIGCFLSHYKIWKKVIEQKYKQVMILEDDLSVVPFFKKKLIQLLLELEDLDWDLVYLGRKNLNPNREEELITDHLVKPGYSYWTLGYLLSYSGALKLVQAKPLENILPVDEFLPIMYGQHPNYDWSRYFETKEKITAFSAIPLLVYPRFYTGDEGHISDTEDSSIVENTSLFHTDL